MGGSPSWAPLGTAGGRLGQRQPDDGGRGPPSGHAPTPPPRAPCLGWGTGAGALRPPWRAAWGAAGRPGWQGLNGEDRERDTKARTSGGAARAGGCVRAETPAQGSVSGRGSPGLGAGECGGAAGARQTIAVARPAPENPGRCPLSPRPCALPSGDAGAPVPANGPRARASHDSRGLCCL